MVSAFAVILVVVPRLSLPPLFRAGFAIAVVFAGVVGAALLLRGRSLFPLLLFGVPAVAAIARTVAAAGDRWIVTPDWPHGLAASPFPLRPLPAPVLFWFAGRPCRRGLYTDRPPRLRRLALSGKRVMLSSER